MRSQLLGYAQYYMYLSREKFRGLLSWFYILFAGDFFMFSEKRERFVEITDDTYGTLLQEHLDEE